MENYSLFMGAAAVMKMAVEMAAVSMEKPSGGTSPSGRVPEQRLLSPRSWLCDGGGSGRREMNHIATGTAPSLDGELLPLHGSSSGDEDGGGDGNGVDGEAFRGHFPVRQGAGTETPVPHLGFAMAAALEGFAYRGFLRAVIDCNKGMVTFNVDDKEHTVYFPKRIDKKRKMKKFKFGELFKKGTTSTGRPSRASTQIRRSYNEDIIAPSFAPEEDNGAPNASSFPCYDFLTNAGILDDFFTLVNRAGLATYVGDEREQYYMLTKIFVESFKFHNTQYEPTVAFKIYDNPVTMELEEFCRALDIVPVGTARRIDDNPRDLLELYRGITEDDCRTIQRGKIRNIQLPAIKYFAYYIATSILGRENTSNISSYHLAFLNAALTGETSYHLGSLIARRLSSRGPIFGGTIALRILTHLRLPLDSNDVPLTPRRLDIAAMKSHHFVTTDSTIDNMVYRMLFADGNEKEIPLPQPGLFNIDRQSWSLTKEEVEEHMKIQEFHQQHDSENAEPSYDYTVTYPDVSSSTYLEPGRSSSYYGDTTSWGPWE
ncbi:hypothetical protein QYE76_046146 [Lolium multiflorum]|uniref:Arabidopsis retrotransposon Orf1 C-terminal domain-containing protein n=1 Tax=Lolium multiflorum TaxID=4521 RepID=A0AAD8TPD9_LOLMU|nr:hypothetical protein QYE76_046146 [Lolium multiflorum]